MKANEAPEKIYLTTFGFPICEPIPQESSNPDTVWSEKPYTNADSIEYIRADAFNNALDIITELTDDIPEYLCEMVLKGEPDWCEQNCTSDGTIPRVCLLKALKYYKKEE